ncbi:hypothetical protein, partial [Pseudomonas sp. GP01-A4]|uniref:hypothetical protein n=1 Tax=Pseudomonas sp. GP01-A4 TaxID=2070571 RepID=UPI001304A243
YLAAKNGFPFSHGDRVASLRLARLLLPEEKDLDFQIHSLTEIRNDEHSDAQMKQIAELLLVDYYCKQGAVDAAIDVARSGMVATV